MQPPPYPQSTIPATGFVGTGQSQMSGGGTLQHDTQYYKKPTGGILKFIEIGVCLLVIICNNNVNVHYFWPMASGGWVNFVVIMAIFGSAFSFFLHMYEIPNKVAEGQSYRLAEFIIYVIWCAFWLIAAILSAAGASQNAGTVVGPPLGASAFFCFAAIAVYAADTYYIGKDWRSNGSFSGGSGATPYNNFPGAQPGAVTVTSGPGMTTPGTLEAGGNTTGSAYTTFASPSVLGDKPVY